MSAETRKAENEAYLQNEYVQKALNMLSFSEGTKGRYDIMVFGTVVSSPLYPSLVGQKNVSIPSLDRFPDILVQVNSAGLRSSAAGKYQILKGTYATAAASMGLTDFSEHTQDLLAVELIRRRGEALQYILNNDIVGALTKTNLPQEWASLAGAGYGQGENSIAKLKGWYDNASGTAENILGIVNISSDDISDMLPILAIGLLVYLIA